MLDELWFQCLPEDLLWLQQYQEGTNLLEVVDRILEHEDYYDVTDVFQSSVWAVCHAYIDYRIGTSFLSAEELEYTRGRSGVLGLSIHNGTTDIATIRDFLEEYDPGFRVFMCRHVGPPAA